MLRRSVERPRVLMDDRLFWVFLYRHVKNWKPLLDALYPETIIHWHRQGFRRYWRRKSKGIKPGRPPIDIELRDLIREMQATNNGCLAKPIYCGAQGVALLGRQFYHFEPRITIDCRYHWIDQIKKAER